MCIVLCIMPVFECILTPARKVEEVSILYYSSSSPHSAGYFYFTFIICPLVGWQSSSTNFFFFFLLPSSSPSPTSCPSSFFLFTNFFEKNLWKLFPWFYISDNTYLLPLCWTSVLLVVKFLGHTFFPSELCRHFPHYPLALNNGVYKYEANLIFPKIKDRYFNLLAYMPKDCLFLFKVQ